MWSGGKRKVFASTQGFLPPEGSPLVLELLVNIPTPANRRHGGEAKTKKALSLPPDRPEDDGNLSTGISAGIKTVSEK